MDISLYTWTDTRDFSFAFSPVFRWKLPIDYSKECKKKCFEYAANVVGKNLLVFFPTLKCVRDSSFAITANGNSFQFLLTSVEVFCNSLWSLIKGIQWINEKYGHLSRDTWNHIMATRFNMKSHQQIKYKHLKYRILYDYSILLEFNTFRPNYFLTIDYR